MAKKRTKLKPKFLKPKAGILAKILILEMACI